MIKRYFKKMLQHRLAQRYAHRALDLQHWFVIATCVEQQDAIRQIKEIRARTRIGLDNHEAYIVWKTVQKLSKIPGAVAEVGVYQGGTAQLIHRACGAKKLYLFDTFSGLPSVQEVDRALFHTGQFSSNFEAVSNLFPEGNVTVTQGLFPQETRNVIEHEQFSFVHLDVDLYEGTAMSLEFFYTRMTQGGVIVVHDYVTAPGVRKAVDEFFDDKPEVVLEPSKSQALIVKL